MTGGDDMECTHEEWAPACPYCCEPMLALTDEQVSEMFHNLVAVGLLAASSTYGAFAPILKRYDEISTFKVQTCHEGSAWSVIDCDPADMAESIFEEWRMPYHEAKRFAQANAERDG